MVDVPPSRNLPEQATPWGRWIEDSTQEQYGMLANHQQQITNAASTLATTSSDLGKKYQQLVQVTTNLAQSVANVAASGATWAGPVNTTGSGSFGSINVSGTASIATSSVTGNETVGGNLTVNGGTGVTANGGVSSTGVYNNLLSTAYRVQYVNSAGPMGYVPSSRRYKQDIVTAPNANADALKLRVVNFRYKEAVKELGDDAALEWGLIAEEVADLGLDWLVDYDPDGTIMGVKYDRLVLALIPLLQAQAKQIQALSAKVASL